MKIKSIKLNDFKRFTDLTIEGLPETAKLVVMIGPNGCGKSSVFDALQTKWYLGIRADQQEINYYNKHINYYVKSKLYPYTPHYHGPNHAFGYSVLGLNGKVEVDFWDMQLDGGQPSSSDTRVHIRSAYRNDSIDEMSVPATVDPIEERRFFQLIENDSLIASNYRRFLFRWLEISSDPARRGENIGKLQDELLGKLRSAMSKLFDNPKLSLENLGEFSSGALFQFNKGASKGFPYMCLASGEKAAFDLLLDVIVTASEFDDTLFCIDEPEAHIHTKLQGRLLEELYNLIPDNSQLWIATHSIGMVRKAYDLWREDPNSVVFLDFGKNKAGEDRDFDGQEIIEPAEPNPNFWAQTYDIALGDLAGLVVTGRTVFCEGEELDEECYRNIFKGTSPEVCFVSLGARGNVEKSVIAANLAIEKIVKSAKVIGIVDRDKATCGEIKRNAKKGIRTLSRKTIESYLLDDEVLKKLCEDYDASDKVNDLLTAKQDALDENKLKPSDNLKSIVQPIHGAAQKILKSANLGNTRGSFMIDILATRIQPGMQVYKELHEDIFGE